MSCTWFQDLPLPQEETHMQICESKFGLFPLCLQSTQNHTGPLLFSLFKESFAQMGPMPAMQHRPSGQNVHPVPIVPRRWAALRYFTHNLSQATNVAPWR